MPVTPNPPAPAVAKPTNYAVVDTMQDKCYDNKAEASCDTRGFTGQVGSPPGGPAARRAPLQTATLAPRRRRPPTEPPLALALPAPPRACACMPGRLLCGHPTRLHQERQRPDRDLRRDGPHVDGQGRHQRRRLRNAHVRGQGPPEAGRVPAHNQPPARPGAAADIPHRLWCQAQRVVCRFASSTHACRIPPPIPQTQARPFPSQPAHTNPPNTNRDKLSVADALLQCDKYNAANFSSFSDWRLPSIKELYSLIDFRGTGGARGRGPGGARRRGRRGWKGGVPGAAQGPSSGGVQGPGGMHALGHHRPSQAAMSPVPLGTPPARLQKVVPALLHEAPGVSCKARPAPAHCRLLAAAAATADPSTNANGESGLTPFIDRNYFTFTYGQTSASECPLPLFLTKTLQGLIALWTGISVSSLPALRAQQGCQTSAPRLPALRPRPLLTPWPGLPCPASRPSPPLCSPAPQTSASLTRSTPQRRCTSPTQTHPRRCLA
jgi:hypothetical protein